MERIPTPLREIRIEEKLVIDIIDEWCDKKREIKREKCVR